MTALAIVIGFLVGASAGGWSGALVGAAFGWAAGMWIKNQRAAPDTTSPASEFEKRLVAAQKAIDDLKRRVERIEQSATGQATTSQTTEELTPATLNDPSPIADTRLAAPIASMDAMGAKVTAAAAIDATPEPAQTAESIAAIEMPDAAVANTLVGEPVAAVVGEQSGAISSTVESPPAKPPRIPAEPAKPGFIERTLEGNIVAKLGVVILFFGVGFLLKFAYERGMFPPELRLLGVAAASAVMFYIGRRLLESQRVYALVLMGGAMGLLYLDVFFALKTFGIIGAPSGFMLFAALGIATIFLAVKLDARAFAALGLIGAFLAPILASTGSGNHVLLFSYYLVLNLVILGASWFKSWRELNFIGFLFTFAIALLWGISTYRPEHFATVEPFLITFFLLYLAIPILFASRQPPELKGIVDGTLVFGMPMSAAMLQAALTRGMGDYALAWSALGAALVYATLAWVLWRRKKMRLLAEAHLALAIVFGTVAPYFAFDGYPTFAFWTLEGAAIFWMGCRQGSVLARCFALFLQVAAAGYFWWVSSPADLPAGAHAWWNERVVGCMLIAAASLLTAWFMLRYRETISGIEGALEGWAIAWAGVWLLLGMGIGCWAEWDRLATRLSAMLIMIGVILTLFEWIGTALNWTRLRLSARSHVLLLAVAALWWLVDSSVRHPLGDAGAVSGLYAWPFSFMVYFTILHRQRVAEIETQNGWRYQSAWALMLLLATWEALWRYDHHEFGWVLAIGAIGLVAAGLRFKLRGRFAEVRGFFSLANVPLVWSLIVWFAGLHGLIDHKTADTNHVALHLTAAALSIAAFEMLGRWMNWLALRRTQVLLTGAMLFAGLYLAGHDLNPLHGAQAFAWTIAFIVSGIALWRQERDGAALLPAAQYVTLFMLALWLIGAEGLWRAQQATLSLSWQYAAVGMTIALGLAVATHGLMRAGWPFATHAPSFQLCAVLPLLLLALLWTLAANVICNGGAAPLPYLPLLNPLDIAQLAMLGAGIWALRNVIDDEENRRLLFIVFAAAGFFWVNAALLRSVHHWADVPFDFHALLHSVTAQAALSLLWTTGALVIMFAAVKAVRRPWWIVGAALLGITVLKLFVNDLGNTGTVARIVSFIGVGVLLLVIGYVAPVPPKVTAEATT